MKQELEERGYEVPEKWKRDKIKDVLAKELRGTYLGNFTPLTTLVDFCVRTISPCLINTLARTPSHMEQLIFKWTAKQKQLLLFNV